jgi:RNA-directed DNA polymerase
MRDDRQRLATALADAFLAGLWSGAGLRAAAAVVLGARHGWARRLTAAVLTAYPRAPLDRPREFAAFVAASPALEEVAERASRWGRRLPAPLHRPTTPTTMVSRPFPVARVDDAGGLARLLECSIPELLWFADPKGLQRRSTSPQLQHYRSRWISSGNGSARLLEAPKYRLRQAQRTILSQLLDPVPVHDSAHGFVTGRSVRTGAAPHVGAAVVISMDLESFFASISAGRIYGVLRSIGYPEPVAHLLTGLCTQATPVPVLAAMPNADTRSAFRLRRRLAGPHVPQGAPTSPQLANLCAFPLDRRLSAYALAAGMSYSRYADDLTFSSLDPAVRAGAIIAAVGTIVAEEGFVVHTGKTRVRRQHQRQQVTGVVVNSRLRLPREDYDTLRAILHNCRRDGPDEQNRDGHADFQAHLRGRIAWAGSLDAEQGRRLLATFDGIDWS